MPVFCIRTRRPFYPLDLQKKCIEIRRTGVGHTGQPVLFYGGRKKGNNKKHRKYEELTNTLRLMGIDVSYKAVANAIAALFPEGLQQHSDEGRTVRDLFRYLTAKL